jgi:hypothetical protein
MEWKSYIPTLVQSLNEGDPGRRIEYCEWYFIECKEEEKVPYKVCWSDETTFKLNGAINCHNYTFWALDNPHITEQRHMNLPEITLLCGLIYKGLLDLSFSTILLQVTVR